MDRNQKIAIVVLVLVAVLFAVVLVWGQTRKEPAGAPAPRVPNWIKNASRTLIKKKQLSVQEIEAPCLAGAGFSLSAGGACTASIAPSKARVRRARLELVQGDLVQVIVDQPASVPAKDKLRPGRPITLDFFRDDDRPDQPATLTLVCVSVERCAVALK